MYGETDKKESVCERERMICMRRQTSVQTMQ